MIINTKSFVILLSTSILLFSCSQKNNDIDLDLSNLPVIKQKKEVNTDKGNEDNINSKNNKFIEDLDNFKSKDNLLSKFKFGKKDPFSPVNIQFNQFSSSFELTGFLNTEDEIFVFVKYLGNEGIITKDSVGGTNTEFLPVGAKVININPNKKKLKIYFDNEDYIFEF